MRIILYLFLIPFFNKTGRVLRERVTLSTRAGARTSRGRRKDMAARDTLPRNVPL